MPGTLVPVRGHYATAYGIQEYEATAFMPDPLQDEPPVLTSRIVSAATRASMSIARLSALGDSVPNPDMLRRPTMRREAQSTSALEGTFEPLETVLAQDYEAGEDKTAMNDSMREVFNYIDASEYAVQALRDGYHVQLPLIRDLQRTLVHDTASDSAQAGDIRTSQVFIGSPTCRIEDARFVPMPPGQSLDLAVRSLLDWWSSRSDAGLALLDMALFHYQFETLHPFTDGNGRIGRLLIMLQMMERGILSQPLLSVSPWFESRRREYQDRLLAVSTHGEWEEWILFFCQTVQDAAEDSLARVKRLCLIRDSYRSIVESRGFGATTMHVAMYALGHPLMDAAMLERRLGKSRTSMVNALRNLDNAGILRSRKVGRTMQFMASDVLETINAPLGAVNPDIPALDALLLLPSEE